MKAKKAFFLTLALCLVLSLLSGCGGDSGGSRDSGGSGDETEITAAEKVQDLTIDENGLATWSPVEGAVAYLFDLTYKEGSETFGAGVLRYEGTSLPVPYGCTLFVAPVLADGSEGEWVQCGPYGDENAPDVAAFYALMDALRSDGDDANMDGAALESLNSSCSVSFPEGLVAESVVQSGSSLTFQLQGSDGRTITYEASDGCIDGDVLVLNPGCKLWSRDAIGRIVTAWVETEPYVELEFHMGYSFAGETIGSTEELYELAALAGSLSSTAGMEPNFVWAENRQTELARIVSIQFGYEPGLTPLQSVEFNRGFFPEFLAGDTYDANIESRWDLDNGIFDFYLLLAPDTPAASFENNITSVYGTGHYTVGELKDAGGNVVSKNEPLPEGATLEVTIGSNTVDVPLTMPQQTTAETLYDMVPANFAQGTGELKVLAIPVVFADQTHRMDEAHRKLMLDTLGRVMAADGSVTEYDPLRQDIFTLSEYYDTASFGKLRITSFLTDWYTFPMTSADMNNNFFEQATVTEIVDWAKATYPDMDWSAFDNDGNGLFDAVILFTVMQQDPDVMMISGANGATHNTFGYTDDAAGTPDDPGVASYINLSTNWLYQGMTITDENLMETRTILHEFGHNLGLIDYYDVTYSGIDALGNYDMQSGSLGDWNSYSKYAAGWIEPIVVTEELFAGQESIELTIGSAPLTGDAIVIPAAGADTTGTAFDEYILIDLFTPDGLHTYDSSLYGLNETAGVRIYHVDARYVQRTLTNDRGEDCVIGTVAKANAYGYDAKATGTYHIELIQSGGDNTFTDMTDPAALRTNLLPEDFFQPGDVFTAESYSEFFHNGLMDKGSPFGYRVEILSVADGSATIRITRQ